jgi:carboxypeptidase Taq
LTSLPSDYDRAVVRDAIRDYELTVRKSKDMTMREADLEGRGYTAWVTARKESDFNKFSPVLEEIVAMKAEIAAATHPHCSAYDANVDMFERGMKTERLNEIFAVVKRDLWYVSKRSIYNVYILASSNYHCDIVLSLKT